MQNYLKLLGFLKGHRRSFIWAVVLMMLASIFEGVQLPLVVPLLDRVFNDKKIIIPNQLPEFAQRFVDYLNGLSPQTLYWSFPIAVIVLLFIKQILIFAYRYMMSDLSQKVMRDIRDRLYHKIQNLSLNYFSDKRTGELISRITYDVNAIENAVSYGLIDLFRQSAMVVIYLCIAVGIYPQAALLIFIIFPLLALPMSRISKRLRKIAKDQQEKMGDINTILLETISGIKLVKAFGTEEYETKRFEQKNNDFYKIIMKSIKRIQYISPITEVFGTLVAVVIIIWLGRLVMEGVLSTGVFVLFMGAIMSIISPIKKLGNVNALVQQALVANERIYDVLNAEVTVKEKPNAQVLSELKSAIQYDNVSFHYGQESQNVLKSINLTIKKGELVAIVGPTGSGKTTLANLIPRFYDPVEGSVKFDGIDVREATFTSLRGQIGIVTQETILFNDTVRYNLAYGHRHATEKEITEAAQRAYAHKFIEKMPKGYDTVIGDRGVRLSGGEKQRVSIARAILRNPPILILDEATSQLDAESEKYVQEALNDLMKGRTVVAIAHRLSTVTRADKIVVVENGRIVGLGRHDDLLNTCELYSRLHNMQFQS